ncbi:branched-chain amino acid ABC transporter permease [Parathermosynechococcus lividus]
MVGYLISLGIFTATFALFSLGLNLQWGYTGLINFGHVGFLALGSYTTILLGIAGVPMLFAVLAGVILAMGLGFVMGIATLRLREDYLAIVTIGMAEIVRLVALNEDWLTRGGRGVYGFPLPLAQFDPNLPTKLGMIAIFWGVVVAAAAQWWQWLERQYSRGRSLPPWGLPAYAALLVAGSVGLWLTLEPLSLGRGLAIAPLVVTLITLGGAIALLGSQWRGVPIVPIGLNTLAAALVALVVQALTLGLWDFSYRAGLLWLLVLVLAIVVWQLERWIHSPWGRVLKAIREDEEVAKALGKNVFAYKMQSLMLGGAIAAVAGSFYAWQLTFVNPDGFVSLITFQAWTIVVLGGAGNNMGTLLGATLFWAYTALTRFIPLDGGRLEALRMMLIGVLLILLMMWRPQGILGKKEELSLGR